MVGTVLWSAPEVLRGQGDYGKAADVYSFGIVMFECWTREAPFQHPGAPTRHNVREHIMQGGRPVCPVSVGEPPAKYGEVMRWCWAEAASDRPTLDEVAGMLEAIALKGDHSTEGASGDTAGLEPSRHDDDEVSSVQPRHSALVLPRHSGSWVPSFLSWRPRRETAHGRPLLPLSASDPQLD